MLVALPARAAVLEHDALAVPGAVWILPSSARVPGVGGAFYTTDLCVTNPATSETSFTLRFLGHDADGTAGASRTFLLAGGRSVTYADVLGTVFGLSEAWGALRVESASASLVVAAQTSTPASAGGTYGQAVPAFGETEWIRAGAPRTVPGVREDVAFRTNLFLANATGGPVDADVALVDASGRELGAKRYRLPPLGLTQVSRVARDLGVTSGVAGGRLVLSTATGGGAFAAYAALIDAATNDPRTLLAAPAPPGPAVPAGGRFIDEVFPEVAVARDVAYGSARTWDGRTETLRLDVYEPRGDTATSRPALVWIHGGGFTSGSRTTEPMVSLATRFARRGYVCVSIDYRLRPPEVMAVSPSAAILDAMYDARAAVRWLRSQAARLRIDGARIAIGGGSAGAYTALNVAYREEEGESGNPGFSSSVRAVVDFWGALTDLSQMEAGEAPLIVIHGTQDAVVPYALGEALAARAGETGVPCELHPLPGEGHSAWDLMDDFLSWVPAFLYRHVIAP